MIELVTVLLGVNKGRYKLSFEKIVGGESVMSIFSFVKVRNTWLDAPKLFPFKTMDRFCKQQNNSTSIRYGYPVGRLSGPAGYQIFRQISDGTLNFIHKWPYIYVLPAI